MRNRLVCSNESCAGMLKYVFPHLIHNPRKPRKPVTFIDCEAFTSGLGLLINQDNQVNFHVTENDLSSVYTCPPYALYLNHFRSQPRSTPDSQPVPLTPNVFCRHTINPECHRTD